MSFSRKSHAGASHALGRGHWRGGGVRPSGIAGHTGGQIGVGCDPLLFAVRQVGLHAHKIPSKRATKISPHDSQGDWFVRHENHRGRRDLFPARQTIAKQNRGPVHFRRPTQFVQTGRSRKRLGQDRSIRQIRLGWPGMQKRRRARPGHQRRQCVTIRLQPPQRSGGIDHHNGLLGRDRRNARIHLNITQGPKRHAKPANGTHAPLPGRYRKINPPLALGLTLPPALHPRLARISRQHRRAVRSAPLVG